MSRAGELKLSGTRIQYIREDNEHKMSKQSEPPRALQTRQEQLHRQTSHTHTYTMAPVFGSMDPSWPCRESESEQASAIAIKR